jgi:radical SAM superfamily enzyme YgiQ (UPF0313 family)
MRILLVSPESKVWNSRAHLHNGLGYLAGSLLANGYNDVTLHDGAVEDDSVAQVLDRAIAEGRPYAVVGISAPTVLIENGWKTAHDAKARGAITILGGPHLTLQPDESMQKSQVDLVVRGEGESTLVEILRVLEQSTVNRRPSTVTCPEFANILGLS